MLILTMSRRVTALLLLLIACSAQAQSPPSPWQMEQSGTTASLRGVHAVGGGVVWASGTNGTVLRTEDSGYMWQSCAMPPGAEKLDFRAIWAWDANTAIVMSSGPGPLSRLYKTTDGCSHWTLLDTNSDKEGFWDGLLFKDRELGLVLGDPTVLNPNINCGHPDCRTIRMLYTNNGGDSWLPLDYQEQPSHELYQPLHGESFFAASNSSMTLQDGWLWIGTSHARVLRRKINDRDFRPGGIAGGMIDPRSQGIPVTWTDWQSAVTPLAQGSNSSGIFSVAFRDAQHGMVVGGDYTKAREREGTAAWSQDGGATWALSSVPPNGYRSAVAWDAADNLWITVGPSGSDLSRDDGHTWQAIEYAPGDVSKAGEWNALSLPWVVGPNGRIAKLNAEALPHARPRPPAGSHPRLGPPAR